MKRFTMKRITALALALIITLSLCPVTAFAEENAAEYEATAHYVAEDDLGVTNDELFAAYAQREFDEALGFEVPSFWRTSALKEDTVEKEIYDELKVKLAAVASGEIVSTQFDISPEQDIVITAEDLGVSSIFVSNSSNELVEGVWDLICEEIGILRIYECLLVDCPYELYWHDKTPENGGIGTGLGFYNQNGDFVLDRVIYKFCVAADYSATGTTGTFVTNAAKTGATSTAIANAKAIVSANASKSDVEKLAAYKDEICALVSYNTAAANSMSTADGINPWQMIYVFDDNSSTNVVCEGYAKAFQYLCDLSTFDGDIECHTVSGTMSGGTGAGGHMWNVVTIDGKNYLVDVTNCDAGTIGAPDKLFLAHTTNSQNANRTHTFTIGSQDIVFIYGEEMRDLFCDGYLALSTTALVSGGGEELAITTQPTNQSGSSGYVYFTVGASGDGLSYQWQWSTNGTSWANTSLTGYNTNKLKVAAVSGNNGRQYRCVITDAYGNTVTSNVGKLIVAAKLQITSQPVDQEVASSFAYFTVAASGDGLKYQWEYKTATGKNWSTTTLDGAKTNELRVPVNATNNGRQYRCVITDAYGDKVTSSAATLRFPTPKNLKSSLNANGKIVLNWDAVDGAVKYEVWRSTNGGTYSKVNVVTTNSYTNTGVIAGNTYSYKVKAVLWDGVNVSPFSNMASRTAKLPAPTGLKSSRSEGGNIQLNWNAVSGAVKYDIYRSTSQNSGYTLFNSVTGISYVNTKTTLGDMYYYKVKAVPSKAAGASDFSGYAGRRCTLAVMFVKSAKAGDAVSLTWDSRYPAETDYYEIWRSTSADSGYTKIGTSDTQSYTDTVGVPGQKCYYKIKAVHVSNPELDSRYIDCVPASRTYPVKAPTNVEVFVNGKGNVALTWDAVTGAESYEIYRKAGADGTYSMLGTSTETSYVNVKTTAGTTYYYKVKAVAPAGVVTSAYSAVVSIVGPVK